jgi:prevent-host-death family protein
MTKVGMRQLRHGLRDYLRRTEAGESFEVTSFGRPVAFLGPPKSTADPWQRLVAEGKVTPAVDPDTSHLPPPVPATTGTTATEALLGEREEDWR